MDFIRTKKKIENKKIILDIPEEFKARDVEIIILPLDNDTEINNQIMKVSEKSFNEWDNDDDEIDNSL